MQTLFIKNGDNYEEFVSNKNLFILGYNPETSEINTKTTGDNVSVVSTIFNLMAVQAQMLRFAKTSINEMNDLNEEQKRAAREELYENMVRTFSIAVDEFYPEALEKKLENFDVLKEKAIEDSILETATN